MFGWNFVLIRPSKTNTKNILGTAGTQALLHAIANHSIETVSIGGINLSNVQRVLYQSKAPEKGLNGVAIVSAIMAADDPKAAAAEFVKRIDCPPPFVQTQVAPKGYGVSAMLEEVPHVVQSVVQAHPLVHNMINFVVANFAANVALSVCVLQEPCNCIISNTLTAEHLQSCLPTATKQATFPSATVPC